MRRACVARGSALAEGEQQGLDALVQVGGVARRGLNREAERLRVLEEASAVKKQLEQLEGGSSAFGVSSTFGMRDAYGQFVANQRQVFGECDVSMHSLFTSYSIRAARKDEKIRATNVPELLIVDENGFIIEPIRFRLEDTIFAVRRDKCVLNMSPMVPLNEDNEDSCYSVLLLHVPWPVGGESAITGEDSAIEVLARNRRQGTWPVHVESMLSRIATSETNISQAMQPAAPSEEDEDNIDSEEGEDNYDPWRQVQMSDDDADDDHSSTSELGSIMLEGNILRNMKAKTFAFCSSFIARQQQLFMDNYKSKNQAVESCECEGFRPDFQDPRWNKLDTEYVSKLGHKQLLAYNCAVTHISGRDPNQLLMFMSGEGGTGKSEVIKALLEYARLYHGRQQGLYGAAVGLGPTGASANNIGGFTWHTFCKMGRSTKKAKKASSDNTLVMGRNIQGLKFVVLDEVSMISCEDLYTIHDRITAAIAATIEDPVERRRKCAMPFGGLHMLFVGDLYQLPPVMGVPLYVPCTEVSKRNHRMGRELTKGIVERNEKTSSNFENALGPFWTILTIPGGVTRARPIVKHTAFTIACHRNTSRTSE
jgi:hypothetical protein